MRSIDLLFSKELTTEMAWMCKAIKYRFNEVHLRSDAKLVELCVNWGDTGEKFLF